MSSKSAAKTRNMVLDTHDANMFVTGDKPALPAPRSSRGSQSVTVNSTARSSRAASTKTRAPPPKYAASLTGLPSEGGETYSGTSLTYVAVPATVAVAILVEPLALLVAGRSGWRAAAGRFGRCVLRFLVGFLLWTLLLQVIDR